jgi:hypothetical protein
MSSVFNVTAMLWTLMVVDFAGSLAYRRGAVGAWIVWTTASILAVVWALIVAAIVVIGVTHPPGIYIDTDTLAWDATLYTLCEVLEIGRMVRLAQQTRRRKKEKS